MDPPLANARPASLLECCYGQKNHSIALYGQLPFILRAELALFAAMLGLLLGDAKVGRGRQADVIRALWRSLAVETGCAIAILGLVAWLRTLEPQAFSV